MGRGHWPEDNGNGWCGACGAPLPSRQPGQRGADRVYCDESTGRPCGVWARVRTQLASLSERIVVNAPKARRVAVRGKVGGQVASLGASIRYAEGD